MFIADHSFDLTIDQNKTVIEGQIIQMNCPQNFSLFDDKPYIDFDVEKDIVLRDNYPKWRQYHPNNTNFTNVVWHGINLENTGYYSCRGFFGRFPRPVPKLHMTVLKGPNPSMF
jgi:hypothetical protein